jgi:hypothetical protein
MKYTDKELKDAAIECGDAFSEWLLEPDNRSLLMEFSVKLGVLLIMCECGE